MNGVAVMVRQHLHFNVSRVLDVFFQVDPGVSKRCLGLILRLLERGFQGEIVSGDSHPFAATPRSRLDQNREADFVSDTDRFLIIFDQAITTRHDGDVRVTRDSAGTILVSELFHRDRSWADEIDLAATTNFIEMGVFRKESIAWMNRFDVADLGCTDHVCDLQVAIGRFRGTDANRLIGEI